MRINLKPVSINCAFRGGRRFKTKDYLAFEHEMLYLLKGKKRMAKLYYSIHFKFYLKNASSSDLSNFIKVLEDCIVKAGMVEDDRFCCLLTAEKYKSDKDYFEFIIKDMGIDNPMLNKEM